MPDSNQCMLSGDITSIFPAVLAADVVHGGSKVNNNIFDRRRTGAIAPISSATHLICAPAIFQRKAAIAIVDSGGLMTLNRAAAARSRLLMDNGSASAGTRMDLQPVQPDRDRSGRPGRIADRATAQRYSGQYPTHRVRLFRRRRKNHPECDTTAGTG